MWVHIKRDIRRLKMKKDNIKILMTINIVLLGLLMLIPGLTKLFVYEISGVSSMLSGIFLFSWAPMFWAVILIAGEISSGLAFLARWKLKYVAYLPVIILGIAVLTSIINWASIGQTNWSNLIFHLIAIVDCLIIANYKR